jgi:GxxExxY protein
MTEPKDERITAEAQRAAEEDLKDENELTTKIIGCAIDVHRALGPGLLEAAYEECLVDELVTRGLEVRRQVTVPIIYKGKQISTALRLDLIVNDRVVIESKAVDVVSALHEAQLLTYLRLTGLRAGLLINFNVEALRDGVRRKVLSLRPSATSATSAPLR